MPTASDAEPLLQLEKLDTDRPTSRGRRATVGWRTGLGVAVCGAARGDRLANDELE